MGEIYSATDIRAALRTFQEYLRDLTEAKFDQFGTKLRLLINYCEKDEHFRVLAQQLHHRAGDPREWFNASQAGKAAPVPEETIPRLAHQYKTLMELKASRIDLRNFLSVLFTSPSIQEAHARFRQAWLEPMQHAFAKVVTTIDQELGVRDRADLVELIEASIERVRTGGKPAKPAPAATPAPAAAPAKPAPTPEAKAAPAPAKPAAAPAPVEAPAKGKKSKSATAAAAAAKAAAAISGLDVEALVKLLEKSVKGARDLASKVKADVEVDVKILKLELSKSVPDMGVVGLVAEPLQRTGGKIAEIASALAERARAGVAR